MDCIESCLVVSGSHIGGVLNGQKHNHVMLFVARGCAGHLMYAYVCYRFGGVAVALLLLHFPDILQGVGLGWAYCDCLMKAFSMINDSHHSF